MSSARRRRETTAFLLRDEIDDDVAPDPSSVLQARLHASLLSVGAVDGLENLLPAAVPTPTLYDTAEKQVLGMSGRLSTGEMIDYVLVYELPHKGDYVDRDMMRLAKSTSKTDAPDDVELKRTRKRMCFELNLLAAGFKLERELAADELTVFVKVHAPAAVLEREAEACGLKLPLKEEFIDAVALRNSQEISASIRDDGHLWGWVQQNVDKLPPILQKLLKDPPKEKVVFGTFECSLRQKYAHSDEPELMFTKAQRVYLTHSILGRTRYADGLQRHGVLRMVLVGGYISAFPLHDGPAVPPEVSSSVDGGDVASTRRVGERAALLESWGRFGAWKLPQPMDRVRAYYGEKIAIYFSWLGFYTGMLWFPAIVGILVMCYGISQYFSNTDSSELCSSDFVMCGLCENCEKFLLNGTCIEYRVASMFDNEATIFFAIFMAVWSSIFLDFWKRANAQIVFDWRLMDEVGVEPLRPEFVHTRTRKNPVTGLEEKDYPRMQRYKKYLVSMSALLTMVCVVMVVVVSVIVYRLAIAIALKAAFEEGSVISDNAVSIASLTGSIINLIVILILNNVYEILATALTNWENHKTASKYEAHLTFKIFVFQFFNLNASLFYIAFFKGKFTGVPGDWSTFLGYRNEPCPPYGCFLDLAIQLMIISTGKQVVNNVQELLWPVLVNAVESYKLRKQLAVPKSKNGQAPLLYPWQDDLLNVGVTPGILLMDDYLELALQFGFLTLFVAAFPLAPFFALINNIFEIRVDAGKMLRFSKFPIAPRAIGMGLWEPVLEGVSILGVICTGAVIAFTSELITKLVYQSENAGSMQGYIARLYPASPLALALNSSGAILSPDYDCHYMSIRDPNGQPGPFYYKVLMARLSFFIVFEHTVFLFKYIVKTIIPPIPRRVDLALKREAYLAKESLKGKTVENDTATFTDAVATFTDAVPSTDAPIQPTCTDVAPITSASVRLKQDLLETSASFLPHETSVTISDGDDETAAVSADEVVISDIVPPQLFSHETVTEQRPAAVFIDMLGANEDAVTDVSEGLEPVGVVFLSNNSNPSLHRTSPGILRDIECAPNSTPDSPAVELIERFDVPAAFDLETKSAALPRHPESPQPAPPARDPAPVPPANIAVEKSKTPPTVRPRPPKKRAVEIEAAVGAAAAERWAKNKRAAAAAADEWLFHCDGRPSPAYKSSSSDNDDGDGDAWLVAFDRPTAPAVPQLHTHTDLPLLHRNAAEPRSKSPTTTMIFSTSRV